MGCALDLDYCSRDNTCVRFYGRMCCPVSKYAKTPSTHVEHMVMDTRAPHTRFAFRERHAEESHTSQVSAFWAVLSRRRCIGHTPRAGHIARAHVLTATEARTHAHGALGGFGRDGNGLWARPSKASTRRARLHGTARLRAQALEARARGCRPHAPCHRRARTRGHRGLSSPPPPPPPPPRRHRGPRRRRLSRRTAWL